jgi:hypothetical protein
MCGVPRLSCKKLKAAVACSSLTRKGIALGTGLGARVGRGGARPAAAARLERLPPQWAHRVWGSHPRSWDAALV